MSLSWPMSQNLMLDLGKKKPWLAARLTTTFWVTKCSRAAEIGKLFELTWILVL